MVLLGAVSHRFIYLFIYEKKMYYFNLKEKKIIRLRNNRKEHIDKMEDYHILKLIMNFKPKRQRSVGRPGYNNSNMWEWKEPQDLYHEADDCIVNCK